MYGVPYLPHTSTQGGQIEGASQQTPAWSPLVAAARGMACTHVSHAGLGMGCSLLPPRPPSLPAHLPIGCCSVVSTRRLQVPDALVYSARQAGGQPQVPTHLDLDARLPPAPAPNNPATGQRLPSAPRGAQITTPAWISATWRPPLQLGHSTSRQPLRPLPGQIQKK